MQSSDADGGFDGATLQTRMVTALVVVTVLLVGVISYMIYKVITLRKEQAEQSSVQFAQRSKLIPPGSNF
jgi:hypothetical protein